MTILNACPPLRKAAALALTFNVSDAKPRREEAATRSHMLVVFLANAGNAGN